MKFSKTILLAALTAGCLAAQASPPIEFISAVRNAQGQAYINKNVTVNVDITSDPLASDILYSESHNATIGDDGLLRLMIGEGNSDQDFDGINWSGRRYLRVEVDVDGSGPRSLGTMEFAAAPIAMQAQRTESIEAKSPSGKIWRLIVNDKGELSCTPTGGQSSYDLAKVPDKLYFIGTYNEWNVSDAAPMTKVSDTCFKITRELSTGEIFKFVPSRSWANPYDWSGQSCKIGEPNAMQEFGNTPAFDGDPGTYTITVDFFNFVMTITDL